VTVQENKKLGLYASSAKLYAGETQMKCYRYWLKGRWNLSKKRK